MARTYGKCPTCGRDVVYVSENFKNAGVAISVDESFTETIVRDLKDEIHYLRYMLETKLSEMSSAELRQMYIMKFLTEADDKEYRAKKLRFEIDSIFRKPFDWEYK